MALHHRFLVLTKLLLPARWLQCQNHEKIAQFHSFPIAMLLWHCFELIVPKVPTYSHLGET